MKIIREILRVIVAIIFIVSGTVKAIDPIGFSFKLDEYFSPAVFNLEFLNPFTLYMSIFVVVLELLLGVFLLLKIKLRFTLIILTLLCVFFGFLTFYSAYFDVVNDCGCFGDALKLEPWQSFWKDIALLVALLILLKLYKNEEELKLNKYNGLALMVSILFTFYIIYQGIAHEPLVDFRDYKIGTDLKAEKQKIEENPAEYKSYYTLNNSKTGEIIEVSQDDYISKKYWEDENWVLDTEKTKEVLVKKGYESSISQFNIEDESGEDITDKILSAPKVILVFSYKPEKLNKEELINLEKKLKVQNTLVIGVSTQKGTYKTIPNHFMDGTAIKTISRNNPFVLILENGVIKEKGNINDIKSF